MTIVSTTTMSSNNRVDEGFGACDEDYLEAMAVALEALAAAPGGPRLVFVVSHVDGLKARLERSLEIEALPTGSRVANGIRRATPSPQASVVSAAAAATAARACPAPAEVNPSALNPDPEIAGNVYCEPCRQSLRAAWAAKHLMSAKHATAVKKAEGRRR